MSSLDEIKVGDWVICTTNTVQGFTKNKSYRVIGKDGSWFAVEKDDEGQRSNGLFGRYLLKETYQGTPPDYNGILQSVKNMIAETEELNRKLIECQKILDS